MGSNIPTNMQEFLEMIAKQISRFLTAIKMGFRSLMEAIILRLGGAFSNPQFGSLFRGLFSSIHQKYTVELSIMGVLKAGFDISVNLECVSVLDNFMILRKDFQVV